MVVVNVLFLFLIGFNVIRIYEEEPSGGGGGKVSMILQAIQLSFSTTRWRLRLSLNFHIYYVEVEQIDFSGSVVLYTTF